MKTKLCRPVLLPQYKLTWPNCIWLGRISKQLNLDYSYNNYPKSIDPIDDSMLPQQLILISLDPNEKIEIGDNCYHMTQKRIKIANTDFHKDFGWVKVIATQSQLSPEYIQQFIEEYNKGEVEDVEIDIQEFTGCDEDGIPMDQNGCIFENKPKLTNGFVTIVEKPKWQKEIEDVIQENINFCDKNVPFLYNEKEVKTLCKLAMEYAQDRKEYTYQLIDEWFNNNKKK